MAFLWLEGDFVSFLTRQLVYSDDSHNWIEGFFQKEPCVKGPLQSDYMAIEWMNAWTPTPHPHSTPPHLPPTQDAPLFFTLSPRPTGPHRLVFGAIISIVLKGECKFQEIQEKWLSWGMVIIWGQWGSF